MERITILFIIVCVILISILIVIGLHTSDMNKRCEKISEEVGALEYYVHVDWSFQEVCIFKICELDNGKFFCHEEEVLMEAQP